MQRKFPVTSVDRGQHPSKYRSSFEATLRFHSERKDDASAYAHCLSNRHTGMPILRSLSARFSTIPEPGKAMMPIGRASSIASLRLNGTAFLCRVQSGSNATGATLRLSAQQAAMRSARFYRGANRGLTAILSHRPNAPHPKGRSKAEDASRRLVCSARNGRPIRAGEERSRRGALRLSNRLLRHRCSFRPARGPLDELTPRREEITPARKRSKGQVDAIS